MKMSSPIIIPLDTSYEQSISLARSFTPDLCRLKVGNQLFTSSGPRVIDELCALGYEVFLDLKFHDIPNTVFEAVKSVADLEVWMTNIHISGGSNMLDSAKRALDSYKNPPLLIGVTMLTSLSHEDVKELGINDLSTNIINLAQLAKDHDLDGVVCSAQEVSEIKRLFGNDFITVTPGIRPVSTEDDQTRVSTPQEAIKNGSDYLVIGRPITASKNPLESLEKILRDINL
tara:strand:- start:278 stop:967 length:690 start_codon:yes stop_codon:yes gene_type:complete